MTRYLLAMAVMVAMVVPASANLLTNGGFEDGATGNITAGVPGWLEWGSSGWHHDDAGRVIGTKAIKFWWDDAGMWQDVPVVGGQNYEFSIQAFNASAERLTGWNGWMRAEFYGSSGENLLTAPNIKYYSATDPVDQWVSLSGVVTAPAGAVTGRMVFGIADWQPTGVSGALNFDEASIALVPEPATLGLLGLAMFILRRRGR
jgi:hypothetical protein